MDLQFLWGYRPDLIIKFLVSIMVAQILLTLWLYIKMGKARFAAVNEGLITRDDYKVVGEEPDKTAIYTRALANQFELPVLFYAVVVTSFALSVISWIMVILAFLFVLTRIVHAREMIGDNQVMKRRAVFINSIRIFILMVLHLFFSVLYWH